MGNSSTPNTNAAFNDYQIDQIRNIVNSKLSLRGTASPLNEYVVEQITEKTNAGVQKLHEQYRTIAPQACAEAMREYHNTHRTPRWAVDFINDTAKTLETKLQADMSNMYTSCTSASNTRAPTNCSVGDIDNTFHCSGNMCTIDMEDKILYVAGDVMVNDTLTVKKNLVAENIHGLVLTNTNQCNYKCDSPKTLT